MAAIVGGKVAEKAESKKREKPQTGQRRRWVRWASLVFGVLLVVGASWFSLSRDAKISGLRNIIQYKVVKQMGGPHVGYGEPPGTPSGTVRNSKGDAVPGAIVLVASPLGDTYEAETDSDGRYEIVNVPPGHYVPIAGKRGYSDAFSLRCAAGVCVKRSLTARSGLQSRGVDFTLFPAALPEVIVDNSIVVSTTTEVETSAPLPGRAKRTNFSFERAALRVNDCWLYEPVEGGGPFPTLLLVLPGPVLGWEIVPVPFAAQGYSVLACYPLRGTNIDGDVADLLTALEYVRQGRVPSRANTERLGLIGASFTSLHAYRLLALTDQVDVALMLGGMANGLAFRHDVETGAAHPRAPFDQVLIALGFPNTHPELYFRYSTMFHLEGLPPLCLLHGREDELVPFNQGVMLDEELTRRGMPHEFHAYEGLSHYFSTAADSATTQQMFKDSLDCLRRSLGGG